MPVAKSDPRRATIVGIAGVMVGTVMILLVLFAGNLGGDSSHTTSSHSTFDVGPARDRAMTIARDQTPLFFPDTATGRNPIVVQHNDTDPNKGWLAFDAAKNGCAIEWHRETQFFRDCNGNPIDPTGGDLHHYPVTVNDDGHVIVDLNPDAASTSS